MNNEELLASGVYDRQCLTTISNQWAKRIPCLLRHHGNLVVIAKTWKVANCLRIIIETIGDRGYPRIRERRVSEVDVDNAGMIRAREPYSCEVVGVRLISEQAHVGYFPAGARHGNAPATISAFIARNSSIRAWRAVAQSSIPETAFSSRRFTASIPL